VAAAVAEGTGVVVTTGALVAASSAGLMEVAISGGFWIDQHPLIMTEKSSSATAVLRAHLEIDLGCV
jgi:hypothetical protein